MKFPPSTEMTKDMGEELKTYLFDSQAFWAGRIYFVLKNKRDMEKVFKYVA